VKYQKIDDLSHLEIFGEWGREMGSTLKSIEKLSVCMGQKDEKD
jgi:hypothetical protein